MGYPLPKEASLDVIAWLGNENRQSRRPPSLRQVFNEMLQLFDLEEAEVISGRRIREHVIYRQLFCYVATQITRASLKRIGIFLGGYDHTTVIYHRDDVKAWIANDDLIFRPIWKYYSMESKIWNRFKPIENNKDDKGVKK